MTRYTIEDSDGGAGRADAITHLNASFGLAGNSDAIAASMKRVRDAAQDDSDYELMRFAQLIIRSEHPPGELREGLLAGVLQRDEALKEIAVSESAVLQQSAVPLLFRLLHRRCLDSSNE
jgi:hypothetical protein